MELLVLAGGLIGALVLLYYTAKKNGRLEEQNRQKALQIQAQAADFRTFEAQMFRWDAWREKVDARLKGIDVRVISDDQLVNVFKDPTIVVEVTDPHSTQLEKGKSTK